MLYNIAVMNTNISLKDLEGKIAAIKQELLQLEPMHPGSVSHQYQVCGNPACKCMHPKKPQKHGPYQKLSYVYHGKPVCRFVRAACVDGVNEQLAAYKKFRSLMDQWIELSIQRGMIEFFTPTTHSAARKSKPSK